MSKYPRRSGVWTTPSGYRQMVKPSPGRGRLFGQVQVYPLYGLGIFIFLKHMVQGGKL